MWYGCVLGAFPRLFLPPETCKNDVLVVFFFKNNYFLYLLTIVCTYSGENDSSSINCFSSC